MQKFYLAIVSIIVCISVSSVWAQIVFNDDDDEERLPYSDADRQSPEGDETDTEDYYDELFHGHRIKDLDKYKRQQGCLCISHLKDPHCGSDNKNYDNGCYFECAQKRNPRLLLHKWGPCG